MVDSGEVFGQVSLARSAANELEELIYALGLEQEEELLEALAPLRRRLKEIHYMTIPWST